MIKLCADICEDSEEMFEIACGSFERTGEPTAIFHLYKEDDDGEVVVTECAYRRFQCDGEWMMQVWPVRLLDNLRG